MTVMLKGIGVSRGISIGRTQILHHDGIDVIELPIKKKQIATEIRRYRKGLALTAKHLKNNPLLSRKKVSARHC